MWKYPVYNYTENAPCIFEVVNVFSEDYFNAYINFDKYYAPDVIVPYPPQLTVSRLKSKAKRRCVFCNKTHPNVTFNNDAHVMPKLMGNKNVIHDIECDSCNEKFSRH